MLLYPPNFFVKSSASNPQIRNYHALFGLRHIMPLPPPVCSVPLSYNYKSRNSDKPSIHLRIWLFLADALLNCWMFFIPAEICMISAQGREKSYFKGTEHLEKSCVSGPVIMSLQYEKKRKERCLSNRPCRVAFHPYPAACRLQVRRILRMR